MFGIDGIEFLVIILIALIAVGPKDMPKMLRALARAIAQMRSLGREFRGHFDEALRQADMQNAADKLRQIGDSVQDLDMRRKLREFYASLERETELEKEQRLQAEQFARAQDLPAWRADEVLPIDSGEAEEIAASPPPQAEPIGDFASGADAPPSGDKAAENETVALKNSGISASKAKKSENAAPFVKAKAEAAELTVSLDILARRAVEGA